MEITKLGHACVRITSPDGHVVVVDPGAFSDPDALRGAHAVLVTHEHADHVQPDRLRAALAADAALQLWTNASVAQQVDGPSARVHVVGEGDRFDLDGLEVQVHGQWHADIHPEVPVVPNIGFLVGGQVFHPGDAFTLPGVPVDTLLVPLAAPWSKAGEVLDYVRAVGARRAYPVHDAILSDIGRSVVGGFLDRAGAPVESFAMGESHAL